MHLILKAGYQSVPCKSQERREEWKFIRVKRDWGVVYSVSYKTRKQLCSLLFIATRWLPKRAMIPRCTAAARVLLRRLAATSWCGSLLRRASEALPGTSSNVTILRCCHSSSSESEVPSSLVLFLALLLPIVFTNSRRDQFGGIFQLLVPTLLCTMARKLWSSVSEKV